MMSKIYHNKQFLCNLLKLISPPSLRNDDFKAQITTSQLIKHLQLKIDTVNNNKTNDKHFEGKGLHLINLVQNSWAKMFWM